MSKHQPSRALLTCTFSVLLAGLGIASQSQQSVPSKSPGLTTSCLYDFELGVIPDCLQKAGNGELSVKRVETIALRFSWLGCCQVYDERLDVCFTHRKGGDKRSADNGQLGGHFPRRLGSSR